MFQIKLSIDGMRCGQCEVHVKRHLETIDGALSIKASHVKNEVTILSPRSINRKEFEQALASYGYRIEGYQAEEKNKPRLLLQEKRGQIFSL